MPKRTGPEDEDLTIKFGGGLHTRAPEDEIGEREAADGYNFLIDVENSNLRPRAAFDLVGTAPNGSSILGGGSFRKSDGTVAAFIQAGATVYEYPFVAARTVTITIASPAVVSLTAHGYVAGDAVVFATSGALPTGLVAGTIYYVIAAGLTANAFRVSATSGGSAINTSGTQSGVHTSTPVLGTVNASAKLRGHWRAHSWELDAVLLISDLALLEVVKQWGGDGTTWANVAFLSAPSVSFGAFYCKYINVAAERAMYSNIRDAGGTFGHMMVGSLRSDYKTISVSNRPSSALSAADPFFLLTPDLRKINGFVSSFGTNVLSTDQGRIFNLTGDSSVDFAFAEFYPCSAASGQESLAYIGNDVIYGRQGRIESVRDTDRFGDTEADDLTLGIADQVRGYTGWRTVFNSRLNRVYLFPDSVSEVWVFDTAMQGGKQSQWMRWRTSHALAFQPTFVMSMLDPVDGLEYVFMGDSTGKVYRLEGTGVLGDGGTTSIQTVWVSKLFSLPLSARMSQIEGYVKYRKGAAAEIAIQLEYAGETVFDEEIIVTIPATTAGGYYSGGYYYTNGNYYGTAFLRRMVRQRIEIAGGDANEFQVRVTSTGTAGFDLNEIGLRFKGAS